MNTNSSKYTKIAFVVFSVLLCACQPIKEFHKVTEYNGRIITQRNDRQIVPGLPLIVIVADNSGTEIFDLLAPYYIFSSAQRFNVIIAAPEKKPFLLWKGVFAIPHFTIPEIRHLEPELIVVPALHNDSDTTILSYLKSHSPTKKLSICEGSRTLAKAGLLDSVLCTTHASTIKDQRKKFPGANWKSNIKYTEHDHIYTTAGVSAAVEGSLHLVDILLGDTEMKKIMADIQYPYEHLQTEHQSNAVGLSTQLNILLKTWFKSNKRIGVLLDNNIHELQLAAILDAYNRTFPASIATFTTGNEIITSKYGLQFLPQSDITDQYDEIHIPQNGGSEFRDFNAVIVDYSQSNGYLFPEILDRIEKQYSTRFRKTVERLLDYH